MHNIRGARDSTPPRGNTERSFEMSDATHRPRPGFGYVRTLSQQEELPLLRDHLLRLDAASRHGRFNAYMEDEFVESYAAARPTARSSSPIWKTVSCAARPSCIRLSSRM